MEHCRPVLPVMKRLLLSTMVPFALIVAACGSDATGSSSNSAPPATGAPGTAAPAGAATVSIAKVDGVGDVLVDSSGRALYTPKEEATGSILCTGDCLAFWRPLAASSSAPTAASGVPSLGVVDRPDGGKQVTVGGLPLYTFSEDAPGTVTGNGVTDSFAGTSFTWGVVMADGSAGGAPSGPTPSMPGGGYGGGAGY